MEKKKNKNNQQEVNDSIDHHLLANTIPHP